VTVVVEITGDLKPGLVRYGAFAGDVEPTIAGDETIEANLVDLGRYRLVAPDLEGKIAGMGTSEAAGRSVYAAAGFPFQVFAIEIAMVGEALALDGVVGPLDELFRGINASFLCFVEGDEGGGVDEGD